MRCWFARPWCGTTQLWVRKFGRFWVFRSGHSRTCTQAATGRGGGRPAKDQSFQRADDIWARLRVRRNNSATAAAAGTWRHQCRMAAARRDQKQGKPTARLGVEYVSARLIGVFPLSADGAGGQDGWRRSKAVLRWGEGEGRGRRMEGARTKRFRRRKSGPVPLSELRGLFVTKARSLDSEMPAG